MLFSDRTLFGHPFEYIEHPEKMPSVTLNIFPKTLPEV